MERRLVPAESPFAADIGYSRAVRVGPHVHVAGTAAYPAGGGEPPADAYGQAHRILEIIVAALVELGARPEDVVRTRIFVTSADDWAEVGRAHEEVFGAVRPASSLLVITGLADPRLRVEIEADAFVDDSTNG